MRKRIALLLFMTLAVTILLAACKQADPTKIIPRWTEDEATSESYVYEITLADFNINENDVISESHFNSYHNDADDANYYKDFDVRTGEPLNSLDEVRPKAVTGTFELTISYSKSDNRNTLTTKQNLEMTYEDKDGKLIDANVLAEMEAKGLVVAKGNGTITLKSTTETQVVFTHDEKQAPHSSYTKVDGFYVGKAHQEISNYTVETTYTYEGRNTVVAIALTQNGKKEEFENTLKRYTEGSFIDSNQMLTYTRSFDKSTGSFQDSPSVVVYSPLSQKLQTANFYFYSAVNAVLTDNTRGETGESIFTKLPIVGVMVAGLPFMVQESLPTLKEKLPDLFDAQGFGPDCTYYGLQPYAKHTPVRFRVHYLSYELAQYDDVIWNALKAPASTEK